MRNILRVAVIDGLQYLFEYSCCVLFLEEFFLYDLVEEFTSATDFCDKINIFLVFEELIQLDDVRVIKSLQYCYFLLKALPVFDLLPSNYFACANLTICFVGDLIDHTICA